VVYATAEPPPPHTHTHAPKQGAEERGQREGWERRRKRERETVTEDAKKQTPLIRKKERRSFARRVFLAALRTATPRNCIR
jgi:hypothetical protein